MTSSEVGSGGDDRGDEAGASQAAVQRSRTRNDDDEDDTEGGAKAANRRRDGEWRCGCVFLAQDREEMDEEDLGELIGRIGMKSALITGEEVIGMEYLVIAVPAAGVLFVGRHLYLRLERWNRSRRLRGAQACLDAVHDTLVTLAESNPKVRSGRSS
jgi:hypothetical protein